MYGVPGDPRERLYSLPGAISSCQGCPTTKTSRVFPQLPSLLHSHFQGQLLNSLSCLHFFKITTRRPTRSKTRAMTPMDPERVLAAVLTLRRAPKGDEVSPAAPAADDHHQSALGSLPCACSLDSGLPPYS